jgi:hypothetical protein
MDLREFVTQTLTQVVEGVKEAQTQVDAHGAEINPPLQSSQEQLGKQGFLFTLEGPAQIVQFDVALTVVEGTGTKGGIGVFAGVVTLGSSGESQKESSSVSRVKFSVPMRLPRSAS